MWKGAVVTPVPDSKSNTIQSNMTLDTWSIHLCVPGDIFNKVNSDWCHGRLYASAEMPLICNPNWAFAEFADWIFPLLWFPLSFLVVTYEDQASHSHVEGKIWSHSIQFWLRFLSWKWSPERLWTGPNILTKNGCCGAIFSHRHDSGLLDPT